jgi:hypothetical protein
MPLQGTSRKEYIKHIQKNAPELAAIYNGVQDVPSFLALQEVDSLNTQVMDKKDVDSDLPPNHIVRTTPSASTEKAKNTDIQNNVETSKKSDTAYSPSSQLTSSCPPLDKEELKTLKLLLYYASKHNKLYKVLDEFKEYLDSAPNVSDDIFKKKVENIFKFIEEKSGLGWQGTLGTGKSLFYQNAVEKEPCLNAQSINGNYCVFSKKLIKDNVKNLIKFSDQVQSKLYSDVENEYCAVYNLEKNKSSSNPQKCIQDIIHQYCNNKDDGTNAFKMLCANDFDFTQFDSYTC